MDSKRISRWLAPAACLVCASLASGAGFTILEQSVSGLGDAFAGGSAAAEDASTMFYNPAGMIVLGKTQFIADVHYLTLDARFHNTGSTTVSTGNATAGADSDGGFATPVPSMYFVQQLSTNWAVGFSINAPFGLGTEYDDGWVGRYMALKSEISTYDFSPCVAYKINDQFSVGAGLDVYYIKANLTNAIDFNKDGTTLYDGGLNMKADDQALGYHLGVMYQALPSTRFGLSYRSKVRTHLSGTADFTVPQDYMDLLTSYGLATTVASVESVFADQGVGAELDLPQSASLSVIQSLGDAVDVMADVTWTDWSSFKILDLNFEKATTEATAGTPILENWRDTFRYSVGASYKVSDTLKLRCGTCYDMTAIRSAEYRSPRIPDSSRIWIATGFTWKMSERSNLDFAYVHIFVKESEVDNSLHTKNQILVGNITASMDIVSLAYSYTF